MFSRFTNPHVAKLLVERGGIDTAPARGDAAVLRHPRLHHAVGDAQPEEVIALLNRYFSLQVDVVLRHGGSLDKFIGDCIMAIWGAPLDDPTTRSTRSPARSTWPTPCSAFKRALGAEDSGFDVGIGVHSGPAVVGLIGSQKRLEYTAIGDTVNLASRIEGLTKDAKRRVLVSKDTAELCGDAFEFVSLRYISCQRPRAAGRVVRAEAKDHEIPDCPAARSPARSQAEPATLVRASELKGAACDRCRHA